MSTAVVMIIIVYLFDTHMAEKNKTRYSENTKTMS